MVIIPIVEAEITIPDIISKDISKIEPFCLWDKKILKVFIKLIFLKIKIDIDLKFLLIFFS
jgi:hypothetical protein